eukprot:9125605-Pyramimonas_sp.AAC.1
MPPDAVALAEPAAEADATLSRLSLPLTEPAAFALNVAEMCAADAAQPGIAFARTAREQRSGQEVGFCKTWVSKGGVEVLSSRCMEHLGCHANKG